MVVNRDRYRKHMAVNVVCCIVLQFQLLVRCVCQDLACEVKLSYLRLRVTASNYHFKGFTYYHGRRFWPQRQIVLSITCLACFWLSIIFFAAYVCACDLASIFESMPSNSQNCFLNVLHISVLNFLRLQCFELPYSTLQCFYFILFHFLVPCVQILRTVEGLVKSNSNV